MKNNTAHTSLPPGVPWTLPASPQPGGTAEVYLSAVAPDLELTVLPLCRATEFLPCFDESDICHNIRGTPLMFSHHAAQKLTLGGRCYLVGPVLFFRAGPAGEIVTLTAEDLYTIQQFMETHSVTLMFDRNKLTCICID